MRKLKESMISIAKGLECFNVLSGTLIPLYVLRLKTLVN